MESQAGSVSEADKVLSYLLPFSVFTAKLGLF